MAWPPASCTPDAVASFASLQTLVLNQCCLSWEEVWLEVYVMSPAAFVPYLYTADTALFPDYKFISACPDDSL